MGETLSNLESVLNEVNKTVVKKVWDNYIEVTSVQKNERLKFIIAAGTRDGFRCINIREFYYVKRDDVWKPGKDGIVIPLTSPLKRTRKPDPNQPVEMIQPMKDMLVALQEAIQVATTMPLEDEDSTLYIETKARE